jgi:hypothetical protein
LEDIPKLGIKSGAWSVIYGGLVKTSKSQGFLFLMHAAPGKATCFGLKIPSKNVGDLLTLCPGKRV